MDIMEMERTAREAMADGDLKKSRDIYNKLIELMPQNPLYFTYLGEVYQRLGNAAEAQRCRAAAAALMNPRPVQAQQTVAPQAAPVPVETNTAENPQQRARFCWKCGSPVEEFNNFCGKCGAGPNPTPVAHDGPGLSAGNSSSGGQAPPPERRASARQNGFFYGVTGILLIGLIIFGALYGASANNLNKANNRIAALKTDVSRLEVQLAAETASAAALQVNLTKTESDLTAANAAVTATQANLDKASSDLAAAVLSNTAQAASLKKVQDPRHFDTVSELTGWLAKDDTNTNPAYASLSSYSKAFILQVRALRDGYLLPACLDWDASYIYTWNAAVVGGNVYSIDPTTDVLTKGPAFSGAPPSHPLPLP